MSLKAFITTNPRQVVDLVLYIATEVIYAEGIDAAGHTFKLSGLTAAVMHSVMKGTAVV